MMPNLMRKAEQLAASERRRAMRRVAEMLAARLPGNVEITDSGVEVRGRGLNRRWLEDPAARFMRIGK